MRKNFSYKNAAHKILKQWMIENNLTGKYVIHHRDDTEECRAYNAKEAHYNMWGFNLDGTFEYGKFVIFLTNEDHSRYHAIDRHPTEESKLKNSLSHIGHPGYFKGKCHSDEAKQRNRAAHLGNQYCLGRKLSDETKAKISESNIGKPSAFKGRQHTDEAKEKNRQAHLGLKHSEETKQKMCLSHLGKHSDFHPSDEARKKMSDAHKGKLVSDDTKQKLSTRMQEVRVKYQLYKANGGCLKWQAFQSALRKNEIPVSFFDQII